MALPPHSSPGTQHTDAACDTSYPTVGYDPADGAARHPLFLSCVGTAFSRADHSAEIESIAARTVAEPKHAAGSSRCRSPTTTAWRR